MSPLVLTLIISVILLVFLALSLLLYALFLRWQTLERERLEHTLIPLWEERISAWLKDEVLIHDREDNPQLFLRYMSRVAEVYEDEERRRLGKLLLHLGMDAYIIGLLNSHSSVMKAWGIHLIGLYYINSLKHEVKRYVRHNSSMVTYVTSLTMARLFDEDTPEYFSLLNKLTVQVDAWTTQKLGEVLVLMGPRAGENLLRLVERGDAQGRMAWFIIDLVGEMSIEEAGPVLIALLDRGDETAIRSIRSLGLIRYKGAVIPLVERLSDSNWVIRAQAAKTLGDIKDERSIGALSEALTDSEWWVRHNAAQALVNLGNEGQSRLRYVASYSKDKFARDIATLVLKGRGEEIGVVSLA